MAAALHSTISTTINHFLAYCESQNIDVKGVSGSIVVGLCAGVSIIVVLVFYPGEHKQAQINHYIVSAMSVQSSDSDGDMFHNYRNNLSLIAYYQDNHWEYTTDKTKLNH